MGFQTIKVGEGVATLIVPDLGRPKIENIDRARSLAPVFYNPRQKLNRDSAVLALGVLQKRLSRPITACEPMCGTGARGIRLALEVGGVKKIVLGDLNPLAVKLAEENASLNGVSNLVDVRLIEANTLLSLHAKPRQRFDYIDIDPYGTPAPFLDAAVRACRRGGLLALTATDMAPLCGVNPKACMRKYGGRPLRTRYCHELALRLVAGAIVSSAARHESAARLVFSYAADHYVRLYVRLDRGATHADRCLEGLGYVLHCFNCSNRKESPQVAALKLTTCEICGSEMEVAGPLWLGDLAEKTFCEDMLKLSERSLISVNRRLMDIIRLVHGEIGFPPGFYNIDMICSKLGIPSVASREILSALKKVGFKSTMSHIDMRGIKTDATVSDLEGILTSIFTGKGGGSVP